MKVVLKKAILGSEKHTCQYHVLSCIACLRYTEWSVHGYECVTAMIMKRVQLYFMGDQG